jgi:hypothetical protein
MRLFARLEYEQKSCLICGSYFIPIPKQTIDSDTRRIEFG